MKLKSKLIKLLMGKGFCVFGKETKSDKVIINVVMNDEDFAHKALVSSMLESPRVAKFIIEVMKKYIEVTEEKEEETNDRE